MPTTTNPHKWQPLRWFDRHLPRSIARCRYCIAPRIAHPMPQWFTVRALNDLNYYDNHEAHEIDQAEHASTGDRNE